MCKCMILHSDKYSQEVDRVRRHTSTPDNNESPSIRYLSIDSLESCKESVSSLLSANRIRFRLGIKWDSLHYTLDHFPIPHSGRIVCHHFHRRGLPCNYLVTISLRIDPEWQLNCLPKSLIELAYAPALDVVLLKLRY
jgi:hypothetical protein